MSRRGSNNGAKDTIRRRDRLCRWWRTISGPRKSRRLLRISALLNNFATLTNIFKIVLAVRSSALPQARRPPLYSDCASNLLTYLGDKNRYFVRKFVEIIDEVTGF